MPKIVFNLSTNIRNIGYKDVIVKCFQYLSSRQNIYLNVSSNKPGVREQ